MRRGVGITKLWGGGGGREEEVVGAWRSGGGEWGPVGRWEKGNWAFGILGFFRTFDIFPTVIDERHLKMGFMEALSKKCP